MTEFIILFFVFINSLIFLQVCKFVCKFIYLRHLSLMAEECSDDMLLKWFRVIECLGAGGISPVDDIIQAIPVFSMFPYHFSTLPRQHIVSVFPN